MHAHISLKIWALIKQKASGLCTFYFLSDTQPIGNVLNTSESTGLLGFDQDYVQESTMCPLKYNELCDFGFSKLEGRLSLCTLGNKGNDYNLLFAITCYCVNLFPTLTSEHTDSLMERQLFGRAFLRLICGLTSNHFCKIASMIVFFGYFWIYDHVGTGQTNLACRGIMPQCFRKCCFCNSKCCSCHLGYLHEGLVCNF